MLRRLLLLTFVATLAAAVAPLPGRAGDPRPADADSTHSIAWVCARHLDRVQHLFGALDLDHPGLERARDAARRTDWPAACAALLDYYRTSSSGAWLRHKPVAATGRDDPRAERVMNWRARFYQFEVDIPRRPDGGVDWSTRHATDVEMGSMINSHSFILALARGYLATGKLAYVRRLDNLLCDWILSNPYPDRATNARPWRGLEVAERARRWDQIFYGLVDVPAFAPGTRILMLSSLVDHAHCLRHYAARTGNHLVNEMSGLATIAVAWPEFARAGGWIDYAARRMREEASAQVYPDGVQKELTSHYHRIALGHFEEFEDIMDRAGRADVAGDLRETTERMWNYLAYVMRPDGFNPMNNDSAHEQLRARVTDAAARYHRPDWLWIATGGARGIRPDPPPSRMFPWAGQLVMRDGFGPDAQWAFFDVGPYGIAHQHNDKLHLSIVAFGRSLLVDSGRYTYNPGPARDYFAGARGHNVVLVDGTGPRPPAAEARAALSSRDWSIQPAFDWARGSVSYDVGGTARHTRSVMYVRGRFWVVVDRIDTDRPRDVEALWHFHPDCTVVADSGSVATVDENAGDLRIVSTPAGGAGWKVAIVRGATDPMQGWYSEEWAQKTPNPTAVYTTRIDGPAVFVWLLVPGSGPVASARVAAEVRDGVARVTVDEGGGETHLEIPIDRGVPRIAP